MSLAAYEQLVRLAERELELARAGRLEEVAALWAERDEHVASLPPRPPADARPALERAAALQQEITLVLAETAQAVTEELRRVDRGRAVARTYAPAGGAPSSTVDRSA